MDIISLIDNSSADETDKQAVAREVIVSAGNILTAAGFRRDEIAGFFQQAADHLAITASRKEPSPPVSVPPARSIAEMRARFVELAPVRALVEIVVGPQVIAGLRSGLVPARPHIELVLSMLPQVAEAQNWLHDTAHEAGLQVVANRQQWLADAPPEDLAQIGQKLFLDDFEALYNPFFDLITAVIAAVVCENDEEALNVLLQALVSCGVIVTHDLKLQLEAAVVKLVPMNIAAV
jgi:hypothetical protein